jgi:general secretion pathway protein D
MDLQGSAMMNRLIALFGLSTLLGCGLPGCTTPVNDPRGDDAMMREGLAGTGAQRAPLTEVRAPVATKPATVAPPASERIMPGTGSFISRTSASPSPGRLSADDPGVMFNFTQQPIQNIVNLVLGEVLHEDYSIGQGVGGEVTFSTSRPVSRDQALSILQTLLSWTNNAMIRQGNRYLVLPANQAVAGQLVPQVAMGQPAAGLSARFFALDYLSATEMQKLLKPFAREDAFLVVEPSRNILVMAGTPEELRNYQSTIDTFDVNWLKGMSIGVFNLKRAKVSELIPQLDSLFGEQSGTPLAGMLRFLPVERTNAVVAISSQPQYLHDVGAWIKTIDEGGGNDPAMYVYDARNLKATDLARYLRQMYTNATEREEPEAQVAPGLRTVTLSSSGMGNGMSNGLGNGPGRGASTAGGAAGQTAAMGEAGSMQAPQNDPDSQDSPPAGDDAVRITAQKSSNQLLIRCRPSEWTEILAAIEKLDIPPMQVQIETRILEVALTGDLNLGVQWYLGRLAGNSTTPGIGNTPGSQGALGGGGAGLGAGDALFYSFVSNNLQIALHALEANGSTRVLSAPSLVVMNNQQAQIQVGDNIPINQTSINTNNTLVTTSSVQYVQTGVILDVVPRINPGGLIYMDIQQQVSDASQTTDAQGNPTISTRSVSTQVAVQSGETVLLGGLIQENRTQSDTAVPYLGRVPGLGWLFSNTRRSRGRSELIVLITPRVINNQSQARQITDQYRQGMELLRLH